jgi:hypothetical protein
MRPRSHWLQRLFTLAFILAAFGARSRRIVAAECAADTGSDRWIVTFPSELERDIRAEGIEIWDHDDGVVIGGASASALKNLAGLQIEPTLKVHDDGQWIYILSHQEGIAAPPVADVGSYPLGPASALYLIPSDMTFELPRVKPYGGFRGVPRSSLPETKPHAADVDEDGPSHNLVANPLVTQIVNATSQAQWFQDVKDMSGENTVVVGGVTRTIMTRWSNVMFPPGGPTANAYASEYILEKGANWGYTGVREPYTSTDSGCSQNTTWQNLVFTLPGQVDFGGHQQVIFVTHYDSLSFNNTESANYAPGADDAISGGSALFEALRLFRNYGFKNTVKIIFFSGEEQGLCGSTAYTHQTAQHPTADMWRVVNMDQTAYDGNKNGWMNDYNWDATNSPGSFALGQAFADANNDYGPIIPPTNIFRPTNRMCQTDHCPFWNVGVAAIAICEDLMHNEICPCFDQSQTSTCHDTVTQIDPTHPGQLMFDPDFSWKTEKTAVATVAHLAEPLYACPASAPTPTVTPGNNILHLSWPSAGGVTNYVVEKAASCAGPFTPITSVAGATYYDDGSVVNGTSYAYRIRTCPTQTSGCVTAVPAPGPSAVYQVGSATVTADSGDHDNIPDNCELATVQVNLFNDGNTPLTNVRLQSVSSTHSGVQIASTVPQSIPSLAVGSSAPALFRFYIGRNGNAAACFDTIPFTVTAASDQSPTNTRSFNLAAEKDFIASGTFNYGFESDFNGWTVTTGSFTRVAGGAPGSTAFSVHSRNTTNGCDAIASPVITPSGSSTMTMWVNFSIEGTSTGSNNTWDRAVVRAINATTGVKTLLVPTVTPYNTTGDNATFCDSIDQLQGWANNNGPAWTQAQFNLSAFAGISIQVEVRFATDSSNNGSEGFWFDNVQITNASQVACDAQPNSCAALPAEVSPGASPVQFTIIRNGSSYDLRFSEVAGATRYNLYGGSLASLTTGVYNHASTGGICAITDGIGGDGQVLSSILSGSLPQNDYFLVTAQNAAGESVYGQNSSGTPIPAALAACP